MSGIFFRSVKIHLKTILLKYAARFAYRWDLFFGFLTAIAFQLLGPIFFGIAYHAGAEVPGWTLEQVFLLQGILSIIRGVAFMMFLGMLWNTIRIIQKGTFEVLLLRPLPVLWQLMMEGFDEEDVGQLVGGVIVTLLALGQLGWNLNPYSVLFTILCMVLGIVFFFFIAVICAALTLKFVETWRLYEFIDGIFVLASYPRSVYGKGLSLVFTIIVPLFLASYYPTAALLKLPLSGFGWAVLGLALFGLVAGISWKVSLDNYKSAGG